MSTCLLSFLSQCGLISQEHVVFLNLDISGSVYKYNIPQFWRSICDPFMQFIDVAFVFHNWAGSPPEFWTFWLLSFSGCPEWRLHRPLWTSRTLKVMCVSLTFGNVYLYILDFCICMFICIGLLYIYMYWTSVNVYLCTFVSVFVNVFMCISLTFVPFCKCIHCFCVKPIVGQSDWDSSRGLWLVCGPHTVITVITVFIVWLSFSACSTGAQSVGWVGLGHVQMGRMWVRLLL